MEKLFEIMFVFIVGATFGYLLEVAYRSIKKKRLINPGLLVGCCLPIYGSGSVVLYLLCSLNLSFIQSKAWQIVFLIVIATVLMTIIEYVSGLFCLKVLHTRYWDYSDRKLNIQGIICPLFSLIWGVCCLGFYFLVFPWIKPAAEYVSTNTILLVLVGMYYGVLFVDLGYSLGLVSKLRTYSIKVKELVNFENLKQSISEKYKNKKGKHSNTFSFRLYSRISKFVEEHKLSKEDKVEVGIKTEDAKEKLTITIDASKVDENNNKK